MVITHFLSYNMYVPNTVRGVLIVYMDEDLRAQIIYIVKHKLRIIDDAFMKKVFEGHDECIELVLQIILDKPDLKVISSSVEYTISGFQGQEIRLDIIASFDGKIVNIEVQRSEQGAGIKRARRNSSYLDANQSDIGRYGEQLAETYVIFITEKDKFKLQLPLYHIERCLMETGQTVNDGAHIIYVNGEYRGNDAVGRLMHDFFCTRATDMNYSVLADRVSDFKESDKGVSDMCESLDDLMQLRQEMFKNQGINQGRAEGRAEGQSEINALNSILIKAGRFDDLTRATEDTAYQQKLIAELLPTA